MRVLEWLCSCVPVVNSNNYFTLLLTLHCIALLIESIFARFLMLHSQNVRLHDFDSVIFSHFLHRHSTLLTLLISGDLTPPVTTDLFPLNCFLKAKPDVS